MDYQKRPPGKFTEAQALSELAIIVEAMRSDARMYAEGSVDRALRLKAADVFERKGSALVDSRSATNSVNTMMPQPSRSLLETKTIDAVVVARFLCPTTFEADARAAIRQLLRRISEEGCRHLVLNLSLVTWVDSSMIGQLLLLQRRMQEVGGRLVLCGVQRAVRTYMQTLQVEGLFDTHTGEPEALQSL
jgi:anti-anti-sigma factor